MTTPPPGTQSEAAQDLIEVRLKRAAEVAPVRIVTDYAMSSTSTPIRSVMLEAAQELATLRAALAPPADDEVEAIRRRHEADNGFESDGLDSAEWRASLTMLATKAHADRATLLHLLDAERARRVEWQPIETAPRDGRYIIAIGAPADEYHIGRHAGRPFCIRYEFDLGWGVYPGYGGAPDRQFTYWKPLDLPATHKDTQDE